MILMVQGLINFATIYSQGLEVLTTMANQHQNSSVEYSDETNSCVVEDSMWDEWTHPSNVCDEVSTSNFLPDLMTLSSSSRLSFHQTDLLSSWMSTFHPLGLVHPSLAAPEPSADIDPHPALFIHDAGLAAASLDHPHSSSLITDTIYPKITSICSAHPGSEPTLPEYPTEDESPLPIVSEINGPKASFVSRQVLQALGPQSPSSPLAIQNGLLNPLGDPWDGSSYPSATSALPSWPIASPQNYSSSGTTHSRIFIPDHSASVIDHQESGGPTRAVSRFHHTDIFIGPNGTFESTPGGWTPQFYNGTAETTTSAMQPMKMMASLPEAGGSNSGLHSHHVVTSEDRTLGSFQADCRRGDQNEWRSKHRLELSVDGDEHHSALQLKRSKFSVGHGPSSALKWGDQGMRGREVLRTYNCPSGSLASQAMDIIAIGPALNTNGKPRARRGSATDPQSVYARQRRERINDRLKTLQHLVPNGAKVDIVTMLDEAYDYVKFLQYQVTLLKSDEFWMHATPYNYNGMDISNLPSVQTQETESSA